MAVKLTTQYRWMEVTELGALIPPTPIAEENSVEAEGTVELSGMLFDSELEAVQTLLNSYEYIYGRGKEYVLQKVHSVIHRY